MHDHQPQTDDEGFTLIEVVVALGMLVIVSSAALGFFLTGLSDSAQLERRQSAVALTSAAVEGARGVSATMTSATDASGTTRTYSGLVRGRTATAVTTAWNASAAPGRSTTFPMSDPTAASATPAPTPVVPLTSDTTVAGQTYRTTVLIGTCYRLRSNTAAPCNLGPTSTRTATPPTGYVEVVRVIATTTWKAPTARSCTTANPCSYTTAVLVDPGTDPVWTTNAGDAVDDVARVPKDSTTTLNVLANDSVAPAASSPVTVTVQPGGGLTARAQADGTIQLTVPRNASTGEQQLQYTVTNSAGGTTAPAVVRITVTAR